MRIESLEPSDADLVEAAQHGRLTRAKRKIAELLERRGFGSASWDA